MSNIISISISVLGSSLITLLLSSLVLQPMQEKKKYIFTEKKRIYESIIIFAQIALFPQEAKYSLQVEQYDIQKLSDKENVENAINNLKMSIPKLWLIAKDDSLVNEVEKFIEKKSTEQFNILVLRFRDDLYNRHTKRRK
ncbi:MAG: hypothetical protein J1F01_09150 [Oscillospiraceae bacterium]|nr:hypothetical protein [Oscillospiraceae bacterium]